MSRQVACLRSQSVDVRLSVIAQQGTSQNYEETLFMQYFITVQANLGVDEFFHMDPN